MSAHFASALAAAHDAAGSQDYPHGALYVVATPIGNLADITLRALHVLQLADTLACEDTRHTQAMLRAYGIDKTSVQWLPVHQHNEAEAAARVIERLQQGQRVAYVSDAGTPGVSDPGARLVAAVHAAGLRALPLPGASSITAAISVAAAVAHSNEQSGFVFAGFAPSKAAERGVWVTQLALEPRCTIVLEAPHRITELAQALSALDTRLITLARELTKQFEEITTQAASKLHTWLESAPHRTKGEFVVVIHPAPASSTEHDATTLRTLHLLLQELPLKTAVRLATEITGAPRNTVYSAALEWKKSVPEDMTSEDACD